MGSVKAVANAAGIELVRHGSAYFVRSGDAVAFLNELERRGAVVLGAEGFRLEGVRAVPDVDAILDLSELEDRSRSVDETRSFVQAVASPDLLFEFVIQGGIEAS